MLLAPPGGAWTFTEVCAWFPVSGAAKMPPVDAAAGASAAGVSASLASSLSPSPSPSAFSTTAGVSAGFSKINWSCCFHMNYATFMKNLRGFFESCPK